MSRSLAHIPEASLFESAPTLFPSIETVCEYNLTKLKDNRHPVVAIKAVHSGPNASKAYSNEAGVLQPVAHLAKGPRVMLSSNLWV